MTVVTRGFGRIAAANPCTTLGIRGTRNQFSGYGLLVGSWQLVGIILVDCLKPIIPSRLAESQRTFGGYRLAAMT